MSQKLNFSKSENSPIFKSKIFYVPKAQFFLSLKILQFSGSMAIRRAALREDVRKMLAS